VPETIDHFQQLNRATIQGVSAPGVAQADARGASLKLYTQVGLVTLMGLISKTRDLDRRVRPAA
jgi:multidrug efflux pump subunit AcrB